MERRRRRKPTEFNILFTLRRRSGLTQAEVARILGVSQISVSYWERNLRRPSPVYVQMLAQLYGVPETMLLKAVYGDDYNPDR